MDLVDTRRFADVLARTPRLAARVFTPLELDLSGGRPVSLAARWAAKEAVAKVLIDNRGLSWHDCQILNGHLGDPQLELTGTVAAAARSRGIDSWQVSLSHDGHMAVAFVVASRTIVP